MSPPAAATCERGANPSLFTSLEYSLHACLTGIHLSSTPPDVDVDLRCTTTPGLPLCAVLLPLHPEAAALPALSSPTAPPPPIYRLTHRMHRDNVSSSWPITLRTLRARPISSLGRRSRSTPRISHVLVMLGQGARYSWYGLRPAPHRATRDAGVTAPVLIRSQRIPHMFPAAPALPDLASATSGTPRAKLTLPPLLVRVEAASPLRIAVLFVGFSRWSQEGALCSLAAPSLGSISPSTRSMSTSTSGVRRHRCPPYGPDASGYRVVLVANYALHAPCEANLVSLPPIPLHNPRTSVTAPASSRSQQIPHTFPAASALPDLASATSGTPRAKLTHPHCSFVSKPTPLFISPSCSSFRASILARCTRFLLSGRPARHHGGIRWNTVRSGPVLLAHAASCARLNGDRRRL
ncbi:hypothetical protein K438DRAFT_1969588 [Mycena galopus ATCC 62051]|nr:hypothetical protein K438DRAFT_1969588 [Mycena galopus ATCC 62051]